METTRSSSSLAVYKRLISVGSGGVFVVALVLMTFLALNIKAASSNSGSSSHSSETTTSNDEDNYSTQDDGLALLTNEPLFSFSFSSSNSADQDHGNEAPKGRQKIDSSMINDVASPTAGKLDSKPKVIDINGISSSSGQLSYEVGADERGARTLTAGSRATREIAAAELAELQANQAKNQRYKRNQHQLDQQQHLRAEQAQNSSMRMDNKNEAPPAAAVNVLERSHDSTQANSNEKHKRVHNSNHDDDSNNSNIDIDSPNGLGRNQRAKRRKRFQDSDRLRQISDNDESSSTTTTTELVVAARNSRKSPAGDDTSSLKCRVEKDMYLDFEEYKHYSCANCYKNMPALLFSLRLDYDKKSRIWLYDREHSRRMLPNDTETIKATFKDQGTFLKWQECCRQAIECCKTNAKYLPKSYNSKGELVDGTPRDKCPATWDGLRCWPDSPAGECAEQECPEHVYFLEFTPVCRGYVQKECFENGSWFIRDNDHEWSDYTRCNVLDLYATRLLIGSVWHLVSAIVIGPAWIILDKFPNRSRTKRVKILSKLLFWLLLNALLAATQKFGIIGGVFDANTNRNEVPLPSSAPLTSEPTTPSPATAANSVNSQSHLNAVDLHYSHSSSFEPAPLPLPMTLSLSLQSSLAPLATTARPAVAVHLARRQAILDQFDSLSGAMTTITTTATSSTSLAGDSSSAHSLRTSRGARRRQEGAQFYHEQLAHSNGYANSYNSGRDEQGTDDLDEQQRPATSTCSDCDGYNITENDGGEQQQAEPSAIIAPAAKKAEDDDRGKNGVPDSNIKRKRAHYHHSTTTAAGSISWLDWRTGPVNLRKEQTAEKEEVEYVPNAAAAGVITSAVGNGKHEMPDHNIVSKPDEITNSNSSDVGGSKGSTKVARPVIEDARGNLSASFDGLGRPDSPTLATATTVTAGQVNPSHPSSSVSDHQGSRANIRRQPRQVGADASGGGGGGGEKTEQQLSDPSTSSLESSERTASSSNLGSTRCKPRFQHPKKHSHIAVVFVCWIFSVGIRITRLLGYAWMFTGAVYLCSVLHFAPAEPPTSFIKWLMILTNGFPIVIGLVYVIVRTIYEPSPLTLVVKLPYYYLVGDNQYVEYLLASQLDCWLLQSQYDSIEDISDLPNLVLIILNGGLFIITLIIMCRISRPGSTRPEMSLGDYCKAAGTLVVLYGAHYALFVYRPIVEGCINGQIMYYSFLFVDGIQGIAVSYVFCYRTAEGKEIISKYRTNWRQNRRLCCKLSSNHPHKMSKKREYGLLGSHNKRASNQNATTDKNSFCNGKEVATEHICIHDTTHIGGRF